MQISEFSSTTQTPYQLIGGESMVHLLVNHFYNAMESLPDATHIRAMHAGDLSTAREKLFMFLSGWLGGPALYIEQYGHPRLRARHLPFKIGVAERDAWLHCMAIALQQTPMEDALRKQLWESFCNTADFMRNQDEGF